MPRKKPTTELEEIRQACEQDLRAFARFVLPTYLFGQVHDEVMRELMGKDDILQLLPRAHLKSLMLAVYTAWKLTKYPQRTFLYATAAQSLGIRQLSQIKSIFESDNYRRLWPDMFNPEKGRRTQWSSTAITVDHPSYSKNMVRDPSVSVISVGTTSTGFHCDEFIFDDLVEPGNAYTVEGRQTVYNAFGQFASVLNPGGRMVGAGTHYHPDDLYIWLKGMTEDVWDENGEEIVDKRTVFKVIERVVEEDGVFLWPRQKSPSTQAWYGFNRQELSRIKAKYGRDLSQFYSQYYNNPNNPGQNRVNNSFNYLDPRKLKLDTMPGYARYAGKLIKIKAGMDLAFSTNKAADYTALVIVGKDVDGNGYILDLAQIKTDRYQEYFELVEKMAAKWNLRDLRIETNAGGKVIAKYIKERLTKLGIMMRVEYKFNRGDKQERANIVLEPLYDEGMMYHNQGGLISFYEEQVVLSKPKNDDLRDAAALGFEDLMSPVEVSTDGDEEDTIVQFHGRWGGLAL